MSANSRVIKFAFTGHEEYVDRGKRKQRAKCKYCKAKISEVKGTTSAFTKHMQRKHKEK